MSSTPIDQLLASLRPALKNHFDQSLLIHPDQVPLSAPTTGLEEMEAVLRCFLEQKLTMGEKVLEFEKRFAQYIGRRHAIMVNSGSSANLLMIEALRNPETPKGLRLNPGDEVLVPAVTWSTTLTPVVGACLVPVLVDADLKTLNLSVEAARKAIGPKTKAIFVAHILGNSADMTGLIGLAKENGLILLEDSCEALGTEFRGKKTGSFGLAASFSFYFSHHITTIEGGMIVTDDDEYADLMRCLRAHGWTRHMHSRAEIEKKHSHLDPRFLFVNTGFNLRSTDVNAAIGLKQLEKLDRFNQIRIKIAMQTRAALEPWQTHMMWIEPTEGATHTWFGFPLLLQGPRQNQRAQLMKHLEQWKIETRPIVAGNLAEQPFLKLFPHRLGGPLLNAQEIMRRGIYWGSHPLMDQRHVQHIAKAVESFYKK
ncbi:MAG: DegT/DnrJ/EryC1/StrS family aminotransferase [Bdellovibrionales bacterium]